VVGEALRRAAFEGRWSCPVSGSRPGKGRGEGACGDGSNTNSCVPSHSCLALCSRAVLGGLRPTFSCPARLWPRTRHAPVPDARVAYLPSLHISEDSKSACCSLRAQDFRSGGVKKEGKLAERKKRDN